MPVRYRSVVTILLSLSALAAHAARKPKPPLPAQQYPMHQALQGVTIAIEPGDVPALRPDTRLDYFAHGFLPVRVIVTNDTDEPVTLDEARIHFITGDDTVVSAATDDDLERRLFTMKSATGTRLPLGLPIPITVGKTDINKKITQDDDDFGFKTTTVAPHTTVAGYLYYDTQELARPVLDHAVLELRKVKFVTSNRYLDNFEINLHASESAQADKH